MIKKLLVFLLLLAFVPLLFATAPCRIPFQASGFKYANDTLIPTASVSTYVYVDPSGGIAVYSETWATGLQDGYVSVTMGNDTTGNPLNLNWGQTYWLAVSIDGVPAKSYKTQKNYIFAVGDNMDHSYDSRSWGFLPDDLIVGEALLIYFSYDKYSKALFWNVAGHIRWNRLLRRIR